MELDPNALLAAFRVNHHPDAEPSSVELAALSRSIRAYLEASPSPSPAPVVVEEDWPNDGTCIRCGAVPRNPESGLCNTCTDEDADFSDYDAGLLNDFGGGNVEWWQDYIRAEIGRANNFWREQVSALASLSQPAKGDDPYRNSEPGKAWNEAYAPAKGAEGCCDD